MFYKIRYFAMVVENVQSNALWVRFLYWKTDKKNTPWLHWKSYEHLAKASIYWNET